MLWQIQGVLQIAASLLQFQPLISTVCASDASSSYQAEGICRLVVVLCERHVGLLVRGGWYAAMRASLGCATLEIAEVSD